MRVAALLAAAVAGALGTSSPCSQSDPAFDVCLQINEDCVAGTTHSYCKQTSAREMCKRAQSEAQCPTEVCQWDATSQTCGTTACAVLRDGECVPEGCRVSVEEGSFCVPLLSDTICRRQLDACTELEVCEVVPALTGQACALKQFDRVCRGLGQLPCLQQTHCDWNATAGACRRWGCLHFDEGPCQREDGCSWTGGRCRPSGTLSCSLQLTKGCAAANCGLDLASGACVSCDAQSTEDACRGTPPCSWTGQRCHRDMSCATLSGDQCRQQAQCYWSEHDGCASVDDAPPCRELDGQGACSAVPGCRFDGVNCAETVSSVECVTFSRDECKATRACAWSYYEDVCMPLNPCDGLDAIDCLAPTGLCSWLQGINRCVLAAHDGSGCRALREQRSCEAADQCAWFFPSSATGACTATIGCAGRTENRCGDPCVWTAAAKQCDSAPAAQKACPTIDLGTACNAGTAACGNVAVTTGSGVLAFTQAPTEGLLLAQFEAGAVVSMNPMQPVCPPGFPCQVCAAGFVVNSAVRFMCEQNGAAATLSGELCVSFGVVANATADPCAAIRCGNGACKVLHGTAGNEVCISQCTAADEAKCAKDGATCNVTADGTKQCISDGVSCNRIGTDRCKSWKAECQLMQGEPTCVVDGAPMNVSSLSCTSRALRLCGQEYKDCAVSVNGEESCIARQCPATGCTVKKPDCRRREEIGNDGCPLYPCDFNCPAECSDADERKCALTAGLSTVLASTTCMKNNGVAVCEPAPCPQPRCATPAEGCRREDDDRVNELTGCPLFPCGKVICDSCTKEQRVRCATLYDHIRNCVRVPDAVTGTAAAECVAVECPEVDCDPPMGCSYKAEEKPSLDEYGCRKNPCGKLKCDTDECSASDQKACCDPSAFASSCKKCVMVGSNATCIDRPCAAASRMCLALPGCTYAAAPTIATTGVCDVADPCGKMTCEAYDACSAMNCSTGMACKLVGSVPKCVKVNDACDDCPSGECKKRGGAIECIDRLPCDGVSCQDGTACVARDGKPVCVNAHSAPCGGCAAGEECVSKRQGSRGGSIVTEFVCEKKEEKALCSLDECACSGDPCATGEACVVRKSGEHECVELEDKDVEVTGCNAVICAADEVCKVEAGVPKCAADADAVCRGTWCPEGQYCSKLAGGCVAPSCGNCTAGKCVHHDTFDMCVPLLYCPSNWTWIDNACREDADCADGFFCPSATTTHLNAFVPSHCDCNPETGKPGKCSSSVHNELRRCLPKEWSCDVASKDTWGKEEKAWCCSRRQVGCTVYDCKVQGAEGPETWNSDKKKWCCAATNGTLGCDDGFNCFTKEKWTMKKAQWCCEHKQMSCPAPEFDCEESADNATAWESRKKKYCCSTAQVGCTVDTKPIYNCSSTERWSTEKRDYCCSEYGKGCRQNKPAYDCDTEDEDEIAAWTQEHKAFCCASSSRGCAADNSTVGPFVCLENTFEDSEVRRKWCCENRNVGCRAQLWCAKATKSGNWTAGERRRCCAAQNLGCEYTCSADETAISLMSTAQRDYCCETLGLACPSGALDKEAEEDLGEIRSRGANVEFSIKIKAIPWAEIMVNPKKFIRKLVRSLAKLLSGRVKQRTRINVLGFAPLKDDGAAPEVGSDLAKQAWGVPAAWSTDPVDGSTLGEVGAGADAGAEAGVGVSRRIARVLEAGSGSENLQITVAAGIDSDDDGTFVASMENVFEADTEIAGEEDENADMSYKSDDVAVVSSSSKIEDAAGTDDDGGSGVVLPLCIVAGIVGAVGVVGMFMYQRKASGGDSRHVGHTMLTGVGDAEMSPTYSSCPGSDGRSASPPPLAMSRI
ncbi:G-protein coupled receptor [Diplonema papillatum]|nr:G-protein coupled receptor [Diplonema papillatum]